MDSGNRAIALWRNWEAKEKMLLEVFGRDKVAENLWREKLDFLSAGMQRIGSVTPDEKLVLGLIKKSALRLEKELYPTILKRYAYRVKRMFLDRPIAGFRFRRLKKQNIAGLEKVIDQMGIDTARLNLQRSLDFEKQQVDVSLSSPLSAGNRFEIALHLEKDISGQFQLEGYSAKLSNALNPGSNRSFGFKADLGISSREALNLLQGRAVLKELAGLDMTERKWLQMDFSASAGSPILHEFSASGFNLPEQLEKIAGGLNRPELLAVPILRAMEQGNQVVVQHLSGEKVFLEASPLSGKIVLRDEQQRAVTLEKVLKTKAKSVALKPELKISRVRQKQQDQSLGIA